MARRKPEPVKSTLFTATTADTETSKTESEIAPLEEAAVATEQSSPAEDLQEDAVSEEISEPVTDYEILIERGEAVKLSPKSTGLIYFQTGRSTVDNKIYLRIHSQGGGGLHSKEWIQAQAVVDLLQQHDTQAFKSSVLKPLFRSGSANNVSFLAAILRSPQIGLLVADPQRLFQHLLTADFDAKAKALTTSA